MLKIKLKNLAVPPALALALWKGPEIPAGAQLEALGAISDASGFIFLAACVLLAASHPKVAERLSDVKVPLENADMFFKLQLKAMQKAFGVSVQAAAIAWLAPVLGTFDVLKDNPGPCRAACMLAVTLCIVPLLEAGFLLLLPYMQEARRFDSLKKALEGEDRRHSLSQIHRSNRGGRE
jgi:hypothetical protein